MNLLREYIRYLFEQTESPKVIFMAGGPGSGKSTVIRNLGLDGRLKVINPDDQYEETMKAEDIPMDRGTLLDDYKPLRDRYIQAQESGDNELVAELEPEYQRLRGLLSRNMVLFNQARKAAKESQKEHMAAGGEFLVDGTGGNYNEIANQVEKLESAGYDVAMIFVDVPVETSVERDQARGAAGGRRLGQKTVERSHSAVSENKPLYEELFGDDFFYVENFGDNFEASIEEISSGVARFLG
ncbi:MAG TPA: hypothetical protein EYF95_01820 [Flavobacteriales bacterium]|jgi:predicted ABC-type ATPase|nr:hypothetical protein [Flavobacteriales bacterium]